MTATGHDALTRAIAENLARRHSTHTEVVKEALPAELVARIDALEHGIQHLSEAATQLSADLLRLMTEFSSHVHDPPAEMKSIAERVQALEALANRRAA